MKFKSTYLMVLILALLGAYVYFYEIQGEQARIQRESELKKIFSVESDSIATVSLRHGEETIVLHKDAGNWYINEPVSDLADRFVPDGLVRQIAQADSQGVVNREGENLDVYGLNPPKCVLKYTTTQGITDSIRIGSENITGSFVFVQRTSGSPVFLTANSLGTYAVEKTLFDFREREVFRYPRNEINRYRLTNAHGTFDMQKTGDDTWEMTEPIKTRVDKDELDKLVNQILKTRTEKFIDVPDLDLSDYGLKNPAVTWEIWLTGVNAYRKFTIGRRASDEDAGGSFFVRNYAKDEGRNAVFVTDSVLINTFDVDLKTLRSKNVAFFAKDDVKKIKFDYGDSAFVCVQDSADTWNLVEPASRRLKAWKVNGALSDLEKMEAKEFLNYSASSAGKYGFTRPPVRIVLSDSDENIVAQYVFGGKTGDNLYFLDERDSKLYMVDATLLENYKFTIDDLAETEQQNVSADEQ